MGWFTKGNHGPAGTRPILDAVISALKADGVATFGATGYCLGARSCMDLAVENVTKVIVISHPSALNVPEDFEVCVDPRVWLSLELTSSTEAQGALAQPRAHQLVRDR
jgi:dienelactone hydrolase